jgi:hypothetical protein
MDQKNLADLYGLDPIPWSRALEALESTEPQTQSSFIATTRPDGRPHLAGVGALWDSGRVYFVSGTGTRKSRNVAQNANCAISMALKGIDLVFEGVAKRVTDDETLQRIAKAVRGPGLARPRQGRRLHVRLQRAERRPSAVGPLRGQARHGLRGAGVRARRCHPLALRGLTIHRAACGAH